MGVVTVESHRKERWGVFLYLIGRKSISLGYILSVGPYLIPSLVLLDPPSISV